MRNARAGGLRETNSILFEMGRSCLFHPDTKAGVEEEEYTSKQYIEIFFKRPPNKRINYNKFGIASPFCWNWSLLLKDWSDNEPNIVEDFVVIRHRHILSDIQVLNNYFKGPTHRNMNLHVNR